MYKIFKGYIKDVEREKSKHGITTYLIEGSVDSGLKTSFKSFKNIAHGFASDPATTDELFNKGTLVLFAVDETGDGAILSALDRNPGASVPIPLKQEDNEQTKDLQGISSKMGDIQLSPGDWIKKKLDGWIAILYSGLIWLRAKKGVELIVNPLTEMIEGFANRFRINLGVHGTLFFDLDKERGKASFDFLINSDTTGEDTEGTIVHIKAGHIKNTNKKLLLNVFKNSLTDPDIFYTDIDVDGNINIAHKKNKTTINIDSDGNISIKSKSFKFNVNDKAEVEIKEDGKMYVKPEEYYIGKGTTDQPFVRGTALKENYDSVLDLVRDHEHLVINGKAIRSFDLIPLTTKKLASGVELSTNKKMD